MKFLLPKSYRVKHKILEFLAKERMKNGGLNPKQHYTFTLREISEHINEKFEDVNSQMDYLFYTKSVRCEKNEEEVTNPYCWILDKGVESYASYSFINDGKLLQSTLFNNLSTGFFQIIVAIVAVVTIILNYQDSMHYYQEVERLSKEVEDLKDQQTQLKSLAIPISTIEKGESNILLDSVGTAEN